MKFALLAMAALIVLAVATACSSSKSCDLSAHASFGVTAVDAQSGTVICNARITYSLDGGNPVIINDGFANGFDDAASTPTTTSCGGIGPAEQTGTFVIAAAASGYASNSATVVITMGPCHVNDQQVTIELEPGSGTTDGGSAIARDD